MHAELDYNLTHDQWETLKALRGGAPQRRAPDRFVVGRSSSHSVSPASMTAVL